MYPLMDLILVRSLMIFCDCTDSTTDNEDNNNEYYEVLGSTLRTLFSASTSKDFYLSAAPQCPNPDASDPTSLLLLCDFVWVQFYNNPPCNIGTPGFNLSLQGWSQTLSSSKARLYLGAPAWPGADKTAYANIGTAQGMEAVAKMAKGLGLGNFGGVMFWDGAEGMLNQDGGKDIIAWAKTGLAM
jgi:chitinase